MVSQVAVASVVWPDDRAQARIVALDVLSIMCQGGKPVAPPHKPIRHAADPALCLPAGAFDVPLAIPASGPAPPPPPAALALRDDAPPPARGPPCRIPDAAYPRGPPRLA